MIKVAFAWPNCDYLDGKWGQQPKDTYVVGVLPTEIEKEIRPFLPDYDQASHAADSNGNRWFHISVDLKSIIPIHWYYPVSHMWNGASPFKKIDKEIITLKDLQDSKLNDSSKDNLQQVWKEINVINAAIKELNLEKEILIVRLRALQDKCSHSRGASYRDRSGEICFSCPDCGYGS